MEGTSPLYSGGQVYQSIFLISDGCGRAQPTVGGTLPRDVVQVCTKQQDKQATKSNRISSILSMAFASALASRVLP